MKKFKKVIYALTSALITMSTYGVMLTNAETTNDIVTELKADNDISSEIVSGWTTEVLSRQLALYICSSHLPARVVPESELSDGLSKDYVYIEYDPERADVVDTINDHISKRMLDKELFRFYEVGTVSKPLNKVMNYSFDEFSKLSTAEVEALFTENGFTEDKGYKVWTPENYLREVVSVIINEKEYAGILRVFFKANDYEQIAPENAMDTEIYCSDEKLKSDLSLPEEKLSIEQKIRRTFLVGDDICTCLRIEPKSTNINRNLELKIAAMNFVQLSPRFAGFDIEYLSDPKGHTDIDAVLKEFYSDDRDMEERKSFFVISENHITDPDEMNPPISETEKKELTALQKYAEEISEYMQEKAIIGDVYTIHENNVEKLVIGYSDEKETEAEIRAFVSKLNINDKLVKYNRYVWMDFDNDNAVSAIKGDANCDNELSMADAVLIMQSIANPAKFGIKGTDENHITEQGNKNADITGENDGITNADALAVQKKLLKIDL